MRLIILMRDYCAMFDRKITRIRNLPNRFELFSFSRYYSSDRCDSSSFDSLNFHYFLILNVRRLRTKEIKRVENNE